MRRGHTSRIVGNTCAIYFLAEMSSTMAAHVKMELQPELDTFCAWERMSTEFSQLLRAAYKVSVAAPVPLRHDALCSLSSHARFASPRNFTMAAGIIRARAVLTMFGYLKSIPKILSYTLSVRMVVAKIWITTQPYRCLYVNRTYIIEYLHSIVFCKGHSNILEDFLYVTFRSIQFIAMTRANALIDILISRPLRWLSGKARELQEWSPVSMGEVLDLVHDFFEKAQLDGSLFFDAELDIFKPIADKQPLFARWREFTMNDDYVLSPDGSTKHLVYRLTRDELLQPKDSTNVQARLKTIEYLELQCRAGLKKMRDPKLAIRDKLTSEGGKNAIGNAMQQHHDTIGCHATNDILAESVFGTYDMILRRFGGISMEAASGVAQAVRSQVLSLGDNVARRKESRKKAVHSYTGLFHSMPLHEQEALVDLGRLTVKEMRDVDRADHVALDEYHKMRRKSNEEDALDALFTRYALALSFFERWVKRGIHSESQIISSMQGFGAEGEAVSASRYVRSH